MKDRVANAQRARFLVSDIAEDCEDMTFANSALNMATRPYTYERLRTIFQPLIIL